MEIDCAMFASGAEASVETKLLHVFAGGFDRLIVQGLPGAIAPFYLVTRVRKNGVQEAETHELTLRVSNPEGEEKELVPQGKVGFKFVKSTYPDSDSYATIIVQIQIAVRLEGRYKFVIFIDGEEKRRLDLTIVQATANQEN